MIMWAPSISRWCAARCVAARRCWCVYRAVETLRDVLECQARNGPRDWNVDRSLQAIAAQGRGALVLLARQETVGDTLADIVQPAGDVAAPAPKFVARSNGVGARILRDLGTRRLRVMSQPVPYRSIAGFDLEVVEFVPFRPTERATLRVA
jgi:3,4-dihydroxy 2-butanone 4-phosphate synthase / GTP cyclohydrolase II